jgi:hypothetical protein
MFNSRQLQDLAKAKAQAVTDQRNNQGTVEVQPQMNGVLSDPNEAYKTMVVCGIPPDDAGKIVMQGPEAVQSALGFGHVSGGGGTDNRGNAGAFGSEHDVNSRRDNPYGVTSISQGGLGFSGNPEHFQTTGNPANIPGAQVEYGASYANGGQTQQLGQSVPIQQQGNPGGMASALMGVGNIVRSNNGQQPNHNGGATNASNMFNTLAGVNNLVRGNNGTQPTYQPESVGYTPPNQGHGGGMSSQPGPTGYPPTPPTEYRYNMQPNNQPGSPNWGQPSGPSAAGPPGHGGGNPGFSGMMSNTGDTMAALKALAERMRNRS